MTNPPLDLPAIIDTQPVLTPSAEGAVIRCILCDRVRPEDQVPIWHTWVMTVKPFAVCDCDGSHNEPCWHGFEVINPTGHVAVITAVCPKCVVAKGLEVATIVAVLKAHCVLPRTRTEKEINR